MMLRSLVSFLALVASTVALAPAASSRRAFVQNVAAALATSAVALPANANEVVGGKPVMGTEAIMTKKAHGTSESAVQSDLLYGVSNKLADSITNYNRRFAEQGGYFQSTSFEDQVREANGPITFYVSFLSSPQYTG